MKPRKPRDPRYMQALGYAAYAHKSGNAHYYRIACEIFARLKREREAREARAKAEKAARAAWEKRKAERASK